MMKRKRIAFLLIATLILALLPTAAFAGAYTVIDTVSIVNLNPPQAGQPFSTTAQVEGQGYYIANITWEPWLAEEVYAPDTEYSLHVRLEVEDGYQFSDNLVATVNGQVAECSGGPWELSVFGSGYQTGNIVVNFAAFRVAEPNAGAVPSQEVEVAQLIASGQPVDSAGLEIVDVEWSPAAGKFADLTAYTISIYGKLQPSYSARSDFFYSVNDTEDFNIRFAQDLGITDGNWDFRAQFTFPATGVGPGTEAGREPAPIKGFRDVPTGEWYYKDVTTAVELGLIDGKGNGQYKPNDNMTVAEAIKLAACMNQLNAKGKVSLSNGTPWYSTYVSHAIKEGIIEKGDFKDYNALITREQYVDVFSRALPEGSFDQINHVEDNAIPDVRSNDPYGAPIYKLYRAGILTGDAKGNFKPADNIKRSEVAAILTRMMDQDARKEVTLTAAVGADTAGQFSESEIYQLWERLGGYWNQEGDRYFVHLAFLDDVPGYTDGIWESGGTPYGRVTAVQQTEVNMHKVTVYVPAQPETEMENAMPARTVELLMDTSQTANDILRVGTDASSYKTYIYAGYSSEEAYQKFVESYY